MLKRRLSFVALVATIALVAAACGDDTSASSTTAAVTTTAATTTTAAGETTTTAAPTTTAAGPTALVCQVTDTGGVDDKSFNEVAYNGLLQAAEQLGVATDLLESQDATDYATNLTSFIGEGCNLIITVGFLLADDTAASAAANPDTLYAIVDYPVIIPGVGPIAPFTEASTNVRGLNFNTNEAAFLAGYLAAGMSTSHVIGTFGGVNIPPVTVFMDGFFYGAAYYDSIKGTTTTVLGWDPAAPDLGLFTNNFDSLEDGRAFAQNLMDEGADIILPVAGPVGLGSGAAIQDANAAGGSVMMIGVDADMFFSAPDLQDILLTSIQKKMDAAVLNTVSNVVVLGALGNEYFGTLSNGGVDIAPFHNFESAVPAELAAELVQLKADIISGTVPVAPAAE
ncbi:MAG TPA: BMP family ABC transporter substrate-binding protein [Acidimicrobiia bacterium]|nr:BMP family ABC transporter substrate-binding protein [Acidimicrobiia bacterium]